MDEVSNTTGQGYWYLNEKGQGGGGEIRMGRDTGIEILNGMGLGE